MLPGKLRMIYEMVIWSVRVVMTVKRFEQSWIEKALYTCSYYIIITLFVVPIFDHDGKIIYPFFQR